MAQPCPSETAAAFWQHDEEASALVHATSSGFAKDAAGYGTITPLKGVGSDGVEYTVVEEEDTRPNCRRRLIIWAVLLCLLVLRETVGEVAQELQDDPRVDPLRVSPVVVDIGYNKPLLITWVTHSTFASLLPVVITMPWCGEVQLDITRRLVIGAAICNACLFASTYAWYVSLHYTIVAENNAISQCLCVFVYVLSLAILKEKMDYQKNTALLLCVVGITLITFCAKKPASGTGVRSEPLGYLLVVVAIAFYALFEVLYKRFEADDVAYFGPFLGSALQRVHNTLTFVAVMGIINICFLWPLLLVADCTGWEPMKMPSGLQVALLMGVSLTATSLIAFVITGIALTSPLHVSVGMIMLIPIGLGCDYFLHGIGVHNIEFFGCAFIVAGFLVMEFGFCCVNDWYEESASQHQVPFRLSDDGFESHIARKQYTREKSMSPKTRAPIFETAEMLQQRREKPKLRARLSIGEHSWSDHCDLEQIRRSWSVDRDLLKLEQRRQMNRSWSIDRNLESNLRSNAFADFGEG